MSLFLPKLFRAFNPSSNSSLESDESTSSGQNGADVAGTDVLMLQSQKESSMTDDGKTLRNYLNAHIANLLRRHFSVLTTVTTGAIFLFYLSLTQ